MPEGSNEAVYDDGNLWW